MLSLRLFFLAILVSFSSCRENPEPTGSNLLRYSENDKLLFSAYQVDGKIIALSIICDDSTFALDLNKHAGKVLVINNMEIIHMRDCNLSLVSERNFNDLEFVSGPPQLREAINIGRAYRDVN